MTEVARAQGWGVLQGLVVEGAYTAEVLSNLAGGQRRGTVYLHNIDMIATADTERLGGWRAGTFFLYGMNLQGGSPTRLVGDAQGVSNIEAEDAWLLYEAWYEQILFDARLSVLAGLYGLDSEFDVIHTAALFLHSSHGTAPDLSQSGHNGPSIFPFTSLGLRLKLVPRGPLALQLAMLDGVPGKPGAPGGVHILFGPGDGLLIAAEAAYLFRSRDELHRRHVSRTEEASFRARTAIGAWTYTETFDDLTTGDGSGRPLQRARSWGLYALAEGQVFRETADPAQGLALYVRAGVANEQVHRFGAYTGVGAVYTGLVGGRGGDELGLGIAAVHHGGPFKAAQRRSGAAVDAAEMNIELTYLAPLIPWFSLQGDVQYVTNPGTDPDLANAFVVTVRFLLSL